MSKKLSIAEKEEKEVKIVLGKIKNFEKTHPQSIVERACYRYKIANLEKRKAQKKIAQLQKDLEIAQRKLK